MESDFKLESDKQRRIRSARRKEYALRHAKQVEQYDAGFEAKHPRDQGGGDEAGQFTAGIGGSGGMPSMPAMPVVPAVPVMKPTDYAHLVDNNGNVKSSGTVESLESTISFLQSKGYETDDLSIRPSTQESVESPYADRHANWVEKMPYDSSRAVKKWITESENFRPFSKDEEYMMENADSQQIAQYRSLMHAVETAPKYSGEVHRGLGLPIEDEELYRQFTTVGEEFSLDGLSSFSKNEQTASRYSSLGNQARNERPLLLSVETKNGVDISGFESDKRDEEVLVEKGMRYRVVSSEVVERDMFSTFVGDDNRHLGTIAVTKVTLEELGSDNG